MIDEPFKHNQELLKSLEKFVEINEPFKHNQELLKSLEKFVEIIKPYRNLQEVVRTNALELNKNLAATRYSQINKEIAAISKMPEVNKAIIDTINALKIDKPINIEKISSHSLALENALIPSLKFSENIQKSNLQLLKSLESEKLKIIEGFKQQTDIWKRLIQPSQDAARLLQSTMPQIRESSMVWHSSLTQTINRFQELNLLTTKPNLATRLLENSKIYTGFVESTIQRISSAENQKIARALNTSLRLAEVQLLSTTDALSSVIATPIDDEVSDTRQLDLPIIQQEELIAAVESQNIKDEDALIESSPAAKAFTLSRNVLVLVTQCNEAIKVEEKSEIFKPTNKLLEVYADLPWLLPQTKQTFGNFIDCLYFLFYEGAGKDKLRFLKEHGGVLEPADCDLIWCIKHLRNKWLRHDADHGKETQIKKSWKELSAQFNWLGLQHAPINSEHFRYLHSRLLQKAETFLQNILEKLIKSE